MEMAIFAVFALLALGSAIVVVAHRNPVHSTLSLVVTLVATAAMFVLLGAPFIAALQVLIYTGAIVVLFLFVIMLLNVQRQTFTAAASQGQRWGAALAGAAFAGILLVMLWRAYAGVPAQPLAAGAGVAPRPGAAALHPLHAALPDHRRAPPGGGHRRDRAGAAAAGGESEERGGGEP